MNFLNIPFNFLREVFMKNLKNNNKEILDHYFFENKYYLFSHASEDDFAKLLNISKEKLNSYSKFYFDQSFQSLINESRYNHVIEEFQNPINTDLPIDSVIKLCGFENNQAFVEYVKEKDENSYKNVNI
jgi:AraC-like DNA-binding protein